MGTTGPMLTAFHAEGKVDMRVCVALVCGSQTVKERRVRVRA